MIPCKYTSIIFIKLGFLCAFICNNVIAEAQQKKIVTVPVGTILPLKKFELQSVFNLAVRLHNQKAQYEFRDSFNMITKFQAFLHTTQGNDSYSVANEFCNHVQHRSHAILGYYDSHTASTAISYSNTFSIPWLTTSISNSQQQSSMVTPFMPRIDRPIFSMIRHYKWNKLAFFYYEHERFISLKTVLMFASQNEIKLGVRRIPTDKNILPELRKLSCNEYSTFIFDIDSKTSINVMKQLQAMGMMTSEYHFIFTDLSLCGQQLDEFSKGQANITLLDIVQKDSPSFETFSSEYARENPNASPLSPDGALTYDAFSAFKIAITQLSNKGFIFQHDIQNEISRQNTITCHQVPAEPLKIGYQISQAIRNVNFNGMTGKIQFDKFGRRINYSVAFRSLELTGLRTSGTWKDSDKDYGTFTTNYTKNNNAILEKMLNGTIVVTTIMEEPYVMYKKNWKELSGNDRFEGYCLDLLQEMSKLVKMKFLLKLVDDGKYGSLDESTGKWNGMVGEVRYQKAHMALAPLTITSTREAVVDFTKPFMSLGISIMIKKPEKSTPSIFSFMDPLSNEIWICIVFAYTGVSVVLYLVSRFSPYEWHRESVLNDDNPDEEVDPATDFDICNSLWFSLGSFMQQGADISPKSISGRIVGGVWWFFTLIIVSSYTANLAAFLTFERMVSPIKGAEDLLKQTEIKYGTMQSGSTVGFFKKSPIAMYAKMWNVMKNQEPSVFVRGNKEGVARGKYAYLMESTLNDYIEQRKPCNTMKVGPNLDSKGYGIALPKGSPLYDPVNLAILTLREVGVLQKLKKHWWYDKSQCGLGSDGGQSKTAALGLNNVAGVFYVLIFGLAIALAAAVAEYSYKWIKIKKRKRFGL